MNSRNKTTKETLKIYFELIDSKFEEMARKQEELQNSLQTLHSTINKELGEIKETLNNYQWIEIENGRGKVQFRNKDFYQYLYNRVQLSTIGKFIIRTVSTLAIILSAISILLNILRR